MVALEKSLSQHDETILKFISLEVNSANLDNPDICKNLLKVIPATAESFGYEFLVDGRLRVWGKVTLAVQFTDEVDKDDIADDDAFEDFADDQHLTDMFMVVVSLEYDGDETTEESTVALA